MSSAPASDLDLDAIRRYLGRCRELNVLTSQNGWIDDDTLRFGVIERDAGTALIFVEFDEILVEGAGCVAGRVPCHGRLRLRLARDGQVEGAEVI
jgi:hypothetical protein